MHSVVGNLRGREMVAAALFAVLVAGGAQAQNDPFGTQARADAASNMIVLGVQQGISSLPPTSGQAFTYDYNSELGTFVENEQLGPTVLRSTQTIGANRLSLRFATSYFELGETFEPLTYEATSTNPNQPFTAYTQFGMTASANVVLFNFAATYGFTDRIEATVNIPFSVVDASAVQSLLVVPGTYPPASTTRVGAVTGSPDNIQPAIDDGLLDRETISFNALGADFNSGKNVGLGRISVGAKGVLLASDWGELAASGEFFCNSPSQAEFAGSNSPSILPRLIGQVRAAKRLNFHADAGYEYDFDVQQLSRFVWNAGLSVPVIGATFDAGVGGSLFDESLIWTPASATNGEGTVRIRALDPEETELGKNYIDFLFGLKVALLDRLVLGGGVNVPITSDGFRADAIGTVSLEYYFKAL